MSHKIIIITVLLLTLLRLDVLGDGVLVFKYYQGQNDHSTIHGLEWHANSRFEDSWINFGVGGMFAVDRSRNASDVFDAEALLTWRIIPESLIAPFVGMGISLGYSRVYRESDVDREGERPSLKAYGSLFPEVGIRFLFDAIAIECSARYYLSGSTRNDVVLLGVGIGVRR